MAWLEGIEEATEVGDKVREVIEARLRKAL